LAWQYLITISTNLGKSSIGFYNILRQYLYQYTDEISTQNDLLKMNIQTVQDQRMMDLFFQKTMYFWEPKTNQPYLSEKLDSFTANNILIGKYRRVANYSSTSVGFPAVVTKLTTSSNFVFAVNNTANDFLIQSESQISQAENVISSIISRNINLLILIIFLENLALFCLFLSLLIMIKVILNSHGKLFRTLAKVSQKSVHQRLYRLHTLHAHLNEDVELRKFGHDLSRYLEYSDTFDPTKKNAYYNVKKDVPRYHEDRYTLRRLVIVMLRNLSLAFLIMGFGAGLFGLPLFRIEVTLEILIISARNSQQYTF